MPGAIFRKDSRRQDPDSERFRFCNPPSKQRVSQALAARQRVTYAETSATPARTRAQRPHPRPSSFVSDTLVGNPGDALPARFSCGNFSLESLVSGSDSFEINLPNCRPVLVEHRLDCGIHNARYSLSAGAKNTRTTSSSSIWWKRCSTFLATKITLPVFTF
jgi:hypothetical protein